MPSPYDPATYRARHQIDRPQSRFSAAQRRKKQGESDFWSNVGAALPGVGSVLGGTIGAIGAGAATGGMGALQGAQLGAALGGAGGSALGSFATNSALSGQRELDEDTQQQDLLYAALADFYRSGM